MNMSVGDRGRLSGMHSISDSLIGSNAPAQYFFSSCVIRVVRYALRGCIALY